MDRTDGGPAFPELVNCGDSTMSTCTSMNLHRWAMGRVLASLVAMGNMAPGTGAVADAMLAERGK